MAVSLASLLKGPFPLYNRTTRKYRANPMAARAEDAHSDAPLQDRRYKKAATRDPMTSETLE
jgi:hypothetical protein